MNANGHEAFREDAGAYLLGALDEREREAFEGHLVHCSECREEVERLRPAAEALPRSVEQLAPPPSLKHNLMKTVRAEARSRSLRERLGALAPSRMRPTVAWASAAFLVAVGLATGFVAAQALSGDDERTISAQVAPGQVPSDAGGSLIVPGAGEHGAILRVNGLDPLQRGRVYQAWIEHDGAVAPQPTFEVRDDGRGAVAVPDDLSQADAVLVTREPRGGSRTPSEPPIMRVPL